MKAYSRILKAEYTIDFGTVWFLNHQEAFEWRLADSGILYPNLRELAAYGSKTQRLVNRRGILIGSAVNRSC